MRCQRDGPRDSLRQGSDGAAGTVWPHSKQGGTVGVLTDEEGSDDQQSRELHRGLFRGRSAGAGGVRSVVLHVTT